MITVIATSDHARPSDNKRSAIKGNEGLVDSKAWQSDAQSLSVQWAGQKTRTHNVPRSVLSQVYFGIWVPSDHCWMPDSSGNPIAFSTKKEAEDMLEGDENFVVSRLFDGPWAPPQPWG